MERRIIIIAGLCWLLMCSGTVFAEGGTALPNLVGVWTQTQPKVYFHEGVRPMQKWEAKITEQDGYYFRGVQYWEHSDKQPPLGHVDETRKHKAYEPFVGVIAPDGITIYMGEQGDWGRWHVQVVDADTLSVIYVESGPAACVWRTEWKRKR